MQEAAIDTSSNLLVEMNDGVARLTLNRPERRNALSQAHLGELETALARIAADAAVRVVVLAGRGPAGRSRHSGHWRSGWSTVSCRRRSSTRRWRSTSRRSVPAVR